MDQEVKRFVDAEGRITQFPAKKALKRKICAYLAEKFEPGREYTEREVNTLISQWHTFEDLFLLRRELVENGLVKRLPNGSKYWKAPPEE